jgi:hypothetical protein
VLAIRATALIARTVIAGDAPGLSATVTSGKTRRGLSDDSREYVFHVAIINRTGADRQVTRVELRVTYRTRANFLGAVDLVSSERLDAPAGTTVDAQARFITSNVIPRHCRVDAYTLFLFDDQGGRTVIDASLPDVLQADTDGEAPKTWGWD